MLKLLFGAAIGAAAAWFLDPERGQSRREELRGKAQGTVGRVQEKASGTARSPASTTPPSRRRSRARCSGPRTRRRGTSR